MENTLHPQVEALLTGVLGAVAPFQLPTVESTRQAHANLSAALAGPGETIALTWESSAATEHRLVPLRWYVPTLSKPNTLLAYIHGGGWVAGTLDSYDTFCRALALHTGALVMSVGYSLSPEATHPIALEEVYAVFRQARSLASAAGHDIHHLALAGDSAGGHLVAAALPMLASTGSEMPDAVVLIYPVLDAAMSGESYRIFGTGYHLTSDRMRWYWEQYLGGELDKNDHTLCNPQISPLYSAELAQFPPTLIVTAEFDPLRDEGKAFAQRLTDEGGPTTYIEVPGYIHGFLRFRKALTDPIWGPDAVMERIGAFLLKVSSHYNID